MEGHTLLRFLPPALWNQAIIATFPAAVLDTETMHPETAKQEGLEFLTTLEMPDQSYKGS